MIRSIPKEVEIRGIYFPPLLLSVLLGLALAWLSGIALYRLRLDRYLEEPRLVFIALSVIYTIVLSTFVFPS